MKKVLTGIIALALVVSFSIMAMPQKAAAVCTEDDCFITMSLNSKPQQERFFVLSQDFTGWFSHSPVASYIVLATGGADQLRVEYEPERINDMTIAEYFTVKPESKTYLNIVAFGFDLDFANAPFVHIVWPHLGFIPGFDASIKYKAEFSIDVTRGRVDFPAITIPLDPVSTGLVNPTFSLYYVAAYLSDTNPGMWGDRIGSRIYFDLF